jgi:hypothetical protein
VTETQKYSRTPVKKGGKVEYGSEGEAEEEGRRVKIVMQLRNIPEERT